MAFTVTTREGFGGETNSASTRTTASFTPTASSLVLVGGGYLEAGVGTDSTIVDPDFSDNTLDPVTEIVVREGATAASGSSSYQPMCGIWRTAAAASPSSTTCTLGISTGSAHFAFGVVDITGHDATSPVVQSAQDGIGEASANNYTVTLPSAPTVGNLLVAVAVANEEGSTAFSSVTAGSGNTFTACYNPASNWVKYFVGYRVVQSGDSSTVTFTSPAGFVCSVGGGVAVVEIAAGSGSTQLTVAPLDLAVTLDAVSLSQTHQLTVAAMDLAVALDGVTLAVSSSLVVQPLDLAVTLDQVALSQAHTLTAQPLDLAVTLEQVTVTEHTAGSLAVQPLDLAVALDAVALSQAHILTAQPLDLAVALEQVTVTAGVLQLQPDPLTLFVTVDVPQLAVTHVLAVQDMLLAVVLGSAESVAWSVWVGGVEQPAVVEGVWDGAVVQPAVTVEVVA